MPANVTKLGPGTLQLGDVATGFDASCQMTGAVVAWDKNKADDITVLCGDVVGGGTTYTAKISGTFLQDLAEVDGLVAYSWENKGDTVAFVYTPNTAAGVAVSGQLIVDPIDVGSTDDYGSTMTSDFEWDCVGEPTLGAATGGATLSSPAESEVGDAFAEPVDA